MLLVVSAVLSMRSAVSRVASLAFIAVAMSAVIVSVRVMVSVASDQWSMEPSPSVKCQSAVVS